MQQVKEPVDHAVVLYQNCLLVQYFGKQEHEESYMQGHPHQTFSIMFTLCVT